MMRFRQSVWFFGLTLLLTISPSKSQLSQPSHVYLSSSKRLQQLPSAQLQYLKSVTQIKTCVNYLSASNTTIRLKIFSEAILQVSDGNQFLANLPHNFRCILLEKCDWSALTSGYSWTEFIGRAEQENLEVGNDRHASANEKSVDKDNKITKIQFGFDDVWNTRKWNQNAIFLPISSKYDK